MARTCRVQPPRRWRRDCAAAALLLLIVAALLPAASLAGFVTRSGTQLQLDGAPFYFVGCNAYWLAEAGWFNPSLVDRFFAAVQFSGMRVVRTWTFQPGLPMEPGLYDQGQFRGLDYVIFKAGQHGVKLVLALGNFWRAYEQGPERWLAWAQAAEVGSNGGSGGFINGSGFGGGGGGSDVAAFYANPGARQLYKRHIEAVLGRVNTYTGVSYRDDASIMMWDVLNEPRCPGCSYEGEATAAYEEWLKVMSSHTKALAPNQLVSAGTEGLFSAPSGYAAHNPGAGSQCEGEDWTAASQIGSVDVAVAHVYWRQTESFPFGGSGWRKLNFEEYVQFFHTYLGLHEQLASSTIGKPLVLEEFNVNIAKLGISQAQQHAFVALVLERLVASKQSGGALAGVMFWNAALRGGGMEGADDGYNIYLAEDSGSYYGGGGGGGYFSPPPSAAEAPAPQPSDGATSSSEGGGSPDSSTSSGGDGQQGGWSSDGSGGDGGGGGDNNGRKLAWYKPTEDYLDGFRRGPLRQRCADDAIAGGWSPAAGTPYANQHFDWAAHYEQFQAAGGSLMQAIRQAADRSH